MSLKISSSLFHDYKFSLELLVSLLGNGSLLLGSFSQFLDSMVNSLRVFSGSGRGTGGGSHTGSFGSGDHDRGGAQARHFSESSQFLGSLGGVSLVLNNKSLGVDLFSGKSHIL